MAESAGAAARKGPNLGCIIIAIVSLVLLALVLMPTLLCLPEDARRTACASNLKQIGTVCQIWATTNRRCWPDVFGQDSKHWNEIGNTRGDAWSPAYDEGEPPGQEPEDNNVEAVESNTANFWALIAKQGLAPSVFVCPFTDHRCDAEKRTDLDNLRDFRGETFVSYSYQNLLGPYELTRMSAGPNFTHLAVAADANPMRRDFWSGAPGGGVPVGATNKKLAERPLFKDAEETQAWNRSTKFIRHPWELNSPNHDFKGQNVLFLDGHVEWTYHPYCGPNWDNIWLRRRTDVSAEIDPNNIETLRAYNDETSYNGTSTLPENSQDDSFLVP